MITYDKFSFASPPRTASTWFIKAASMCGLGNGFKAKLHEPPPEHYKGFSASMVRHPYSWLVSYYYSLKGGVVGVPIVDKYAVLSRESKCHEEFIRMALGVFPTGVSEMFAAYRPSTVIRVEDLPWAATELFSTVGASVTSVAKVTEYMTPQNARKGEPTPVNKQLKRQVVEAEAEFCETYEYWS